MNIYLLSIKTTPCFLDYVDGFVIRAASNTAARKLAAGRAGGEGMSTWLTPNYSYCTQMGVATTANKDQAEILLRSFNAG